MKQIKRNYFGSWESSFNSYGGSLFIGHCTSENLLDHYKILTEKMNLDSSFLLHLGIDGPNVNLSFEEKLIDHLKGETGKWAHC